eukprot:765307-Hanusia_phi.AAC.2
MGLEVDGITSLSSFGLYDGKQKMWRREIISALKKAPYVIYEDPCKVSLPLSLSLLPPRTHLPIPHDIVLTVSELMA